MVEAESVARELGGKHRPHQVVVLQAVGEICFKQFVTVARRRESFCREAESIFSMGPQFEGVSHLVSCKTEKDDCNEDYAAGDGNVESSTGGRTQRRVLRRIGRLDTAPPGENAALGGAVHDALDTLCVDHLVQVAVDEHAELADKLAVAGPRVVGNVDADQEGVGGELPYREGCEKVVVNPEDGKRLQGAEHLLCDVKQLVALQVELAEVDQVGELLPFQRLQLVSAQVKQLKVH